MPEETIRYRVECLEKDMDSIKMDIKNIMENHLPHLQVEVNTVATLLKVYGTLIVAGITALIVMGLTP